MIRSVSRTALLLGWLTSGIVADWPAWSQSVIVERHRKLQPSGPGRRPFDVTRHTIPLSEIHVSVPRDTIPALSKPHFVAAQEVRGKLNDSDRVLGVFLNGEARAYPVRIVNWHEAVNDIVGGQPILVSW